MSVLNLKLSAMLLIGVFSFTACEASPIKKESKTMEKEPVAISDTNQIATLGAGCFWCVEAVFQELKGVSHVESGYSGGKIKNPSYKEVCTGRTGHAEVVQVHYNPQEIAFKELLEVFFQTHDPTTLNRQGNDVGTQYRSAIYYHNDEQKEEAEFYIEELNKSGAWPNEIVTEVSPFETFYVAENYHQDYFNLNGDQPYCSYVIQPKMEKFKKAFKAKLKD